jgi:hypothetical protein
MQRSVGARGYLIILLFSYYYNYYRRHIGTRGSKGPFLADGFFLFPFGEPCPAEGVLLLCFSTATLGLS